MPAPVIEKHSTVLVSGVNGYVGSHVADLLLQGGYRVRGTVRSAAKGKWVQELFDEKYGAGRFELVEIPDLSVPGAFDQVLKGCSGVAHIAATTGFKSSPDEVIPSELATLRHLLDACAQTPSIVRFVLTSSSQAVTTPIFSDGDSATDPNPTLHHIDETTYNTAAIHTAYHALPADPVMRGMLIYRATKALTEQALWGYAAEGPRFGVYSVVPTQNFGLILNPAVQMLPGVAPSAGRPRMLLGKETSRRKWFVNVRDTARLHIAARTDATLANQRIFAFAAPTNWTRLLAALRAAAPDATFPADFRDDRESTMVIEPRERAEEILRRNFGRGFRGLEESLG